MEIVYGSVPSRWGTIWLARSALGLTRVAFAEDPGVITDEYLRAGHDLLHAPEELSDAAAQIDEYLAGERRIFDLPTDLSEHSPFARAVLTAVRQVPYGETRSYRDIAEAVGRPLGARAVGGAVGVNRLSLLVPCHRIIKSDGTVGYYAHAWESPDRGVARKLALLCHEGVTL